MTMHAATVIPLDRIASGFVERVPIHFARRHAILGLQTTEQHLVEILAPDTTADSTIDNIGWLLACVVRRVSAEADAILDAIDYAYQKQRVDVRLAAAELQPAVREAKLFSADGDLLDNASRAPLVRLLNLLLFDAVQRRASDVHVQPCEEDLVIRLRVDGVLVDYLRPGAHLQDELISRIKVIAGMDIAEKRLPQDGRATVRIGERTIDLRISVVPTAFGERAVIRLLDKGARPYELSQLGFAPDVLEQFARAIRCASGLILMTGPTGSGKSTTLYAALQTLDCGQLNVITLEDPIEYHLPGISQTQVAQRKGLTFATGLRSVLRQDPDVIMVGEIRDEPTARLAIQSALTGHLVLSTLHTNDAPGAIARLLDLGIEPYLVADALLAVGAQRLVRRVCSNCGEEVAPDPDEAVRLELAANALLRRGRGCALCSQTGYYEREGLFEWLSMNERIAELIHQRSPATAIREAAVCGGMRTLRREGIRKVLAGSTTTTEVLRVTQ